MPPAVKLTDRETQALLHLLGLPTAPFRESHVQSWICARLDAAGVAYFQDDAGNIVAGVRDSQAYRRLLAGSGHQPLLLFIAHMDHPGFSGVRWRDATHLEARWFGGSPTKHLRGAKLWLADSSGYWGEGTLQEHQIAKHGFGLEKVTIKIPAAAKMRRPAAKTLFGGFGFRAPVWRHGQTLYTKAADDLAGVFCALETLISAAKRRSDAQPVVLFSRAEEVGFVGAIAHFEQFRIRARRRGMLVVSLEASRTLPGAVVGKGPIVRLGDRRAVFNPDGSQFLTQLAEKTLGKNFQRRIMDGGACEGTAATAYGLPTIAMSVPLGNYHNQGFEGGPECAKPDGPAPEFVHIQDVAGMLAMCRQIVRNAGKGMSDPWRDTRARLLKNYKSLKNHL